MEESEGETSYERQGVATGSQVRVGDWFLKIFYTLTNILGSIPIRLPAVFRATSPRRNRRTHNQHSVLLACAILQLKEMADPTRKGLRESSPVEPQTVNLCL